MENDRVLNLLRSLDDIDRIGNDIDGFVADINEDKQQNSSTECSDIGNEGSVADDAHETTDESTEFSDESTDELVDMSFVCDAYVKVFERTVLPILIALCIYIILY